MYWYYIAAAIVAILALRWFDKRSSRKFANEVGHAYMKHRGPAMEQERLAQLRALDAQRRAEKLAKRRSAPRLREMDFGRLQEHRLPALNDVDALAAALGCTRSQLYWLAAPPGLVDGPTHYRTWEVPKRTGGTRTLAAPRPHLMRAQRWILREILAKVPVEAGATAFRRGGSVAVNASPHAGQAVLVGLDLKDFFPTITFRRARGVFRSLGYPVPVAQFLGALCVYCDHDEKYHFNYGNGKLPQGAPTSPALANLVCRRLDRRLGGLARKFGANYTRYADDITFSGDRKFLLRLDRFLRLVGGAIKKEGFEINWAKRRVRRKGGRQQVCGVVVNERPTLARPERRQLRAMLHRLKTTGACVAPEGVETAPVEWLRGRLAYFKMIDPQAGEPMWAEFQACRPGA